MTYESHLQNFKLNVFCYVYVFCPRAFLFVSVFSCIYQIKLLDIIFLKA